MNEILKSSSKGGCRVGGTRSLEIPCSIWSIPIPERHSLRDYRLRRVIGCRRLVENARNARYFLSFLAFHKRHAIITFKSILYPPLLGCPQRNAWVPENLGTSDQWTLLYSFEDVSRIYIVVYGDRDQVIRVFLPSHPLFDAFPDSRQ